jgi:hypothetical protein
MDNLFVSLLLVALVLAVFVRLFRKAGYTLRQSVWMAIAMFVPLLDLLLGLYFLMTTWPIERELAGLRARAGVPTPGDAQAVLSAAIRLESSGDAAGAVAKYEEVMQRFAGTEAARDAEASVRSLKEKIG